MLDVARQRAASGIAMSAAKRLRTTPFDENVHLDAALVVPPSAKWPSGVHFQAGTPTPLDPLEEALLSRPLWDSREPDSAIHEILYRFSLGDIAGALAAADLSLRDRRVPALRVSFDILDEIELDHCAVLVLAHIDGVTDLSQVLSGCGLSHAEGLRTLCELVERRIVVLRSYPRER
jgi:hypothetical protein